MLAILFTPAIAYYVITRGKNNFKKLEIFGPKEVIQTADENGHVKNDTLYHTIGSFNFTDQYGRSATDKIIDSNIHIAEFFYTSCTGICPEITTQLERVQKMFADDPQVKIVSFSLDPAVDSVPVLMAYAKSHRAVKDKWYFLTGDKKQIYDLIKNSYFLAAMQKPGSADTITHSEQLVLVDRQKRIRGFYDGTDNLEVNRLMDEILVLEWEYKQK